MNTKNVAVADGKIGEEEECFERICKNARENKQNVPFRYFVDRDALWCERDGQNPAIYAELIGGEWVAFFEKDNRREKEE
jgi:hypothetical protein